MSRLKSVSKYYSAIGREQKISKKEHFYLQLSAPFMTVVNKGCLVIPSEPDTLALILTYTYFLADMSETNNRNYQIKRFGQTMEIFSYFSS